MGKFSGENDFVLKQSGKLLEYLFLAEIMAKFSGGSMFSIKLTEKIRVQWLFGENNGEI